VTDGPRLGQRTEVIVEQGHKYDRPWRGLDVWLEPLRRTITVEAP